MRLEEKKINVIVIIVLVIAALAFIAYKFGTPIH